MKLNYLQFSIYKEFVGKYKCLSLGPNFRDKLEDENFSGQNLNSFREKATFKRGRKLFKNVCNRPIVDKGPEENWDKPIRQHVALDELHMLTGGFQKLYYVGKTHFSSMDTWARLSGCKSQGYHGGIFTGGDVKKMLENIGILENLAREQCNFTILRFVEAFRALDWVRKSCFAVKLRQDWSEALAEFKRVVTELIQDEEIGLTCTIKIHAMFFHIREHCQDQILLNPEEPNGLGRVSTQTGESMHKAFEIYLERFNPCWNNVEILNDQLFRAVTSWASKCIWPKSDASGDHQN